MRFLASILIALLLAAASWSLVPQNRVAVAQSAVSVIGPVTPGDCTSFFSQTQLQDAGVAGCFGPGNLTVSAPIIESVAGSNVRIGFAPCGTPVSGQVVYYTAAWGCAYLTLTGDVSSNNLYTSTVVGLQGNAVTCVSPISGQILYFTSSFGCQNPFQGDISTSGSTTRVLKLNGVPDNCTVPVSGQILFYTNAWGCGNAGSGTVQTLTAGVDISFSSGATCTVNCTINVLQTVSSNVLGGNVATGNGTYTDGPSSNCGSTCVGAGVWFVVGHVTVVDTAGSSSFFCKLWDGATVMASAAVHTQGANLYESITLQGFLVSPSGNLRISCTDSGSGTGNMTFNSSGNSKDSSITVLRIQ